MESAVLILEVKLHAGHVTENKMRIKMLLCSCSLGIPAASGFVHTVQKWCQVQNNHSWV